MKNLKTRFLHWKESVRKWCIKMLGGWTDYPRKLNELDFNIKTIPIETLICEYKISLRQYEFTKNKRGKDYADNFIKRELFAEACEELDRKKLYKIYNNECPESDECQYRMIFQVIKPQIGDYYDN